MVLQLGLSMFITGVWIQSLVRELRSTKLHGEARKKKSIPKYIQFSSIGQSCLFATPWTSARQASLSITNSRVYPNSCPSSQRCHPTISSSVVPFSSCLQSFPASGSFLMSQFFASGSQSIGVSASASVLPKNTQD